MPDLPAHPDLAQLRRQAEELLAAANAGDPDARARVAEISDRPVLASAQLAVAREYGFTSWRKLKLEVERREILNERDLGRLIKLLEGEPALATATMEHWCDHRRGVAPLNYVAMLRFDSHRLRLPHDLSDTGTIARALIAAGAPVDGRPGDPETPLITAASYGDADVARVLIDSGADLEATAAPDAGGIPGGTPLLHAAVFGMTDVVDLLVKAGAPIHGVEEAAAAGDVDKWLTAKTPPQARIRALVMAADHQRLNVIDELVAAGTPVDGVDEQFGRHPLRVASQHGRPNSVRRLLEHGANPTLRDAEGRTPLDLCRQPHLDRSGHHQVETLLEEAHARGAAATAGERRFRQ